MAPQRTVLPGEFDRVDRDTIVEHVVDVLRKMNLLFEERVYANRPRPLNPHPTPKCVVYTLSEDYSIWQESPRVYERKLELVIQISAGIKPLADGAADVAASSDGLPAMMRAMMDPIELRLEHDQTLGGLVADVQHKRYEYEPVESGEMRFAFARLFEQVTYLTEAGERPESGFTPLRTIHLETSAGPPHSPTLVDDIQLHP